MLFLAERACHRFLIDGTRLQHRRLRGEGRPTLKDYLALARPLYWVKNALIFAGAVSAIVLGLGPSSPVALATAFAAISLVASANYVLNGWADAKSDAYHPLKRSRPAVIGKVHLTGVALEYVVLAAAGLMLALTVSPLVLGVLGMMLVMGALYNLQPVRLKDRAYLDVLTESVNDALRLLVGWFAVTSTFLPPVSLVLGFWMSGAFLMTVKRLAEFRMFTDSQTAVGYRRSFGRYTTEKLAVCALIYAMAGTFFLGAFLVRYRYEYLLAMPALWALFGWYLWLGFREDSVAQNPEALWREPVLLGLASLVVVLVLVFSFVNIPAFRQLSSTSLVRVERLRP